MGQDKTLSRGARATGVVALSVLALLGLGWIARDFVAASHVIDVWWTWSGMPHRASDGLWATSFVEPTLLVLYAVCAVTTARSSSAAGVLAAAGALTVLLRLPSLWNLNSAWMTAVDGGVKQWAFFSAALSVALGVLLVGTAALGRRPAAASGTVAGYAWEDATPPAPPAWRGALVSVALLGLAGLAIIGWELHTAVDQGWLLYQRALSGKDVLVALFSVPGSWYAWIVVLLSFVAAAAAARRAPFARPWGMTAGALLIGLGLFYCSFALRMQLFQSVGERSGLEQLRLGLAVFELVAGLGALVALAPRGPALESTGEDGAAPPRPVERDYGPGTGPGHSPPPPADPPPNW